jgi:hypothetical protein
VAEQVAHACYFAVFSLLGPRSLTQERGGSLLREMYRYLLSCLVSGALIGACSGGDKNAELGSSTPTEGGGATGFAGTGAAGSGAAGSGAAGSGAAGAAGSGAAGSGAAGAAGSGAAGAAGSGAAGAAGSGAAGAAGSGAAGAAGSGAAGAAGSGAAGAAGSGAAGSGAAGSGAAGSGAAGAAGGYCGTGCPLYPPAVGSDCSEYQEGKFCKYFKGSGAAHCKDGSDALIVRICAVGSDGNLVWSGK